MTAAVEGRKYITYDKKVLPGCQFSRALFVCVGDPQRVRKEEAMKTTGVAVMAVMVGTSVSAYAVQADERQVMVCTSAVARRPIPGVETVAKRLETPWQPFSSIILKRERTIKIGVRAAQGLPTSRTE